MCVIITSSTNFTWSILKYFVSDTNVYSVSVRYILVIFKYEIEFTREPDNNNRQTSFLLTSMSLSVLIYSRRFKRTFTSHVA